ncbi:uncharacterized protein LOC143037404 [Oratosquilla oratoria]|uniref:uncharacterized protein LOC143037404 n=1 Tax=Oratosquilla oratoria TaxID=337810 RepID=UPI003F769CFB
MKSVVLVVTSLLALGSALPVPEEEVLGKFPALTNEQLQLLLSANPEDNAIDLHEPVASPLPLNLNPNVEEVEIPVSSEINVEENKNPETKELPVAEELAAPEETPPAVDNVEEPQEQEVPTEIDASQVSSGIEEPAAPEERIPVEDDEEKLQDEMVPVIPESIIPTEYDVPEVPIIKDDTVTYLEPVVGEESQAPVDENFEVPEEYKIPFIPFGSFPLEGQEGSIQESVPANVPALVGVMDGEEDFSEEINFENDGTDQELFEILNDESIIIDQEGVITGPQIIGNGPAPVVVEYSQEPLISEDDSSQEVIEGEPQLFFVPENDGEIVEEEGVPVDLVGSPEGLPFQYKIETEELDPEEGVLYIPNNEPQEVVDDFPVMDDSFVVPVDNNENSNVFVVGLDDEGDEFVVAMEKDENGEIQREVFVAEVASEDSSEEDEDDLSMEEPIEDGYEGGPVDELPILNIYDENDEVQPEVLIAEIPDESFSDDGIVPMKEVLVVEEEGPNEDIIALAVEDENGNIHGEIIDAEVDGEDFPSEPFPGEGTLPEVAFIPVEDISEEEPDLEVYAHEDGEVGVVGVPEAEDTFPEDPDEPLVEFSDVVDEETYEEPHSVMFEENEEDEVSPFDVTPEEADEEEPFVVMGFNDGIVPVIAPVEIYPEEELRPLPPVAEYPFSPELLMEPEEDIAPLPEEIPFDMGVISYVGQPEEFENEDEEEDETFELDEGIVPPGVIPEETPFDIGFISEELEDEDEDGVFELDEDFVPPGVIPGEIVEILPYNDQFKEDNRAIIFPEDDVPSSNLPVFPYQYASRVALPLDEKLAEDEGDYHSAEENDDFQKPWVIMPLIQEAKEPQVLEVPDKTSNNMLPTAVIPPRDTHQQPQVSMFQDNQNQYQRYGPSFTDNLYQTNRNVQIPLRSSYASYPFQSQYRPKYPQSPTYFDVFNRQPFIPQSYDRYNHHVYYDYHSHDDDSFNDDFMQDDVPIYFEQSTYYDTRRNQNPFTNYKGYAASSAPSYSEYRPYAYNYYRPIMY